MGAKVKPIFTKELEYRFYLGVLNPQGPFPSKVYGYAMSLRDEPVLYVPRIFAYTIIVMDDDNLISHCHCSNCKNSINIFDAYCCHCGAKLKGRKVLGEDYEENSSIHISR